MDQPMEQSSETVEGKGQKRNAEEAQLDENSENSSHPQKKKRINREPSSGVFLRFDNFPKGLINDLLKQICEFSESDDDLKGVKATVIPNERIRVLPSEKEKKEERRRYRETYSKSQKYIERKKMKAEDPLEKEKRKKYNDDEKVIQRKRELAKGRRKTLAEFKELYPDIYNDVICKYVTPIPRAPKKSK